ncbi:trypsin-like peptidase domain-containing protein [uncultured Amaricoccus sp.]|uniref:trypsin-like peptidase domain-containing protein n=1 Tax=uncultured Amaricoccus sp. TaxID=339341 RepID=UPI002604FF31|nr:trypsin-like peptidase domain-containing protein [uncultured Amaricoccus sp.]
MADHFLTKTRIRRGQCIEVGGRLALESYPALAELLRARVSPEAAALFAEPLLSLGNDEAPSTVSWYTTRAGDAAPLASLDGAARAEVEAQLSQELRAIRPLIEDRDDGPLVSAALHVAAEGDIWVVNGRPVIVNWGILPEAATRGIEARTAHFGQTLGRYLPLTAAPPLTEAEWRGRAGTAAPSPPDPTPIPVAAPEPAPKPAPISVAAPVARGVPLAAWLPLLLLLLLAGGTLGWLAMPGTRLFPPAPSAEVTAAVALAEETRAALEARRATLAAAIEGATCAPDGTLVLGDGRTLDGLPAPVPGDPADAPGMPGDALPDATLPPDPARTEAPDDQTLLDSLERSTVLVATAEGATATGFFVAPDLVVTGERLAADGVTVANLALGGPRPATVAKAGDGFALLRVAGADGAPLPLFRSDAPLAGTNILAAGFPAEAGAALALTDGAVLAFGPLGPGRAALAHSAPVSAGGDGGPLVDGCGRVVGVSRFEAAGPLRDLGLARTVPDLLAFLDGTEARPTVVSQACAPRITRPTPPPRVADAGTP